jgi:hypothetical protein
VSWIFSFLLACYACVRLVLWARGQVRWLSIRNTLPIPPLEVVPPRHLSRGLAELFVACRQLRVELVHARRLLLAVEVTDPDVGLGHVRDARYRRALMQSFTQLGAWLRWFEGLAESERAILYDRGLGHERIAALRESLHDRWLVAARARALDPFALADLHAVKQALERADLELQAIERGLAALGEDPYRDRFVSDLVAAS